jgi:putative MATE family efflux protein
MLVGFSDTLLTGHYLGTSHLAAMNLMAYVLWLTYGLFSVVAIGATAMVARFVGAADYRVAGRTVHQAFLIGAVVAAAATLPGLLLADRVGEALQLRGQAAELAGQYLGYVVPVLPLIMIQTVGIACLRGAGDMVTGLVVMAIINMVNVGVSWLLVLGPGPVPRLGWEGLAIGTMCGYLTGGLLVLVVFLRGRAGLRLRLGQMLPDLDLWRRLLRIGLPGGADILAIIACQMWFVAVINRLGDTAAAAHGVAIRIESLGFLSGTAFQVAATTLAGQYLGARDHRKAGRSVLTALAVGGAVMSLAGAMFFVAAQPLAQMFVRADQYDVARTAAPLLQTVALAMPALALTMILSGALRGAGDTGWPLGINLVGFLAVRIPLAYWLAFGQLDLGGAGWTLLGWNLGVVGAWYAMVTDLHVRAALVLYRFLQGGWKRIEI